MKPNAALLIGAVLFILLTLLAPVIFMVTGAAFALSYAAYQTGRRNEALLWATVIAELPPELQASIVETYQLIDRRGGE